MRRPTLSLVFSVHDILCIFLHISRALIVFPFPLSLSTSHSRAELSGKSVSSALLAILFFVCMLTCLSRHNFSNPIIVHDILCIFLHISRALIVFPFPLSLSPCRTCLFSLVCTCYYDYYYS